MILARMKRWTTLSICIAAFLAATGSPAARAEDVAGPIRLVPENPDSYIRVDARFAPKPNVCPARQPRNLHAGYPGIVEVGRRSDGRLYLVTELDFPRYLKGIAEVPRGWPSEALKAQVIAARTYAAGRMNPSDALARELRYNLCATDACQVYRGLVVERGAWGEAWIRAVDETSGEILEWEGKPASTFYFSTSDGRTRSNAEGFGGSPLPYLRSVTETDDTASPLSNWSVRMPLTDLTETLRRTGSWSGGTITAIGKSGETINISGGGGSIGLAVDKFRIQLNLEAVCLVPKRYPTPSITGRPLPQVIPSKWLDVRQDGSDALITGRGWGHGVGMVQWGAKGKADKGMPYADILSFYYGGLRPVKRGEPGAIRVGLAVDIEQLTLERMGSIRVEGASPPAGPVRLTGGPAMKVTSGDPITPVLKLTNLTTSEAASPGAPAKFSFELSDPANLKIRYTGPAAGETIAEPRDRGAQTIDWSTSGLPGGTYEASVVASDGVDEIASGPITVGVVAPSPSPSPTHPSPLAEPSRTTGPSTPWMLAAAAVLLIFGGFALTLVRSRSRRP